MPFKRLGYNHITYKVDEGFVRNFSMPVLTLENRKGICF